jgi:uncharacterized membrane protein YphA (DoxX/SURF4 family)
MKYGVWFVRLLFAAWMIPAGLNHFVPIFPQPMGSQPLSMELIRALLDSHLFDLVKAVELIAGIGVLLGIFTPLSLLICLPVSFCVFWWDAPLEGWGSRAALFGYATLLSNSLLCLAWYKSYQPMFALRSEAAFSNKQLVMGARLLLGLWMLVNGANYLLLSLWSAPASDGALAAQLMSALVNSQLLDVAMAIQLVTGALLLAGVFVPVALCALMPISTCALFWAGLDLQPLNVLMALVAFALNGLLMLAYLPYYRSVLPLRAPAFGEDSNSFDALCTLPVGRIAQAAFIPALATVVAALVFFWYFVPGRTGEFCMLMLMYPTFVLLAQRLEDIGISSTLLFAPAAMVLLTFAIRLDYVNLDPLLTTAIPSVALMVTVAFAIWGGLGRSHSGGDAAS